MKRYIIIISGLIILIFGAYLFFKPKKNKVDVIYVSGPDDPIFKDPNRVVVWDKNKKVINPEGLNKLLRNGDSIPKINIK